MGARHRQRKADQAPFANETREMRTARHRAQRHSVNQTLHEASTEAFDEVVLPEPRATRERVEPVEREPVRASATTFRPWKQPFWKRRRSVRRARAIAWRDLATD